MDLRKTVFTQSVAGLSGFGDGVCHQEFRKMCDTNEILRSFRATGVLPNVAGLVSMPCDQFLFGDFSEDVAQPICEEVNRDHVDQMVHSDSDPAEGSSETTASVEEKVGGVKGEPPANSEAEA